MHRGTTTLPDALDMFLLDCEARRLTPSTRQFYTAKLSVFNKWCEANQVNLLSEVTAHQIRRFLVHIQRRQLSGQYQHNLARAIRAFLNYCIRDELLDKSPFTKIQMPKVEKKIPQALTAKDIGAILRSCRNDRDKAICLFLLDSGVRASEFIALNVGDIDIKTGAVMVTAGKGQKQRTTYVGAKTRKAVKRYFSQRTGRFDDEAPAFASIYGENRLMLSGMVQLMERLRERSGVKECKCHNFRRTFAITCLRNGMNIYVLAKLMGHADITVLRRYLALVQDDMEEAHAKYGAVDSLID